MATIRFVLNKEQTRIDCSSKDYIEDICKQFSTQLNFKNEELIYLYKGKKLTFRNASNEKLKLEDYKQNQMTVFCFQTKKKEQNLNRNKSDIGKTMNSFQSKEILCPECGEPCEIKLDNFKITLYECQNGHETNIDFEQFINMQNNAKTKTKCNYCNIIQDKIYKCLTCKEFICKKCKEKHNKTDEIIEYNTNNFKCNIHNRQFVSYCNKCQQDLCSLCETKHKNENDIINYTDKMTNINAKNKELFKYKINEFNNCIYGIIEILNKIINKFFN